MKRFKMTTCLVLAMLLAFTGTAAFAGTKYSNAVGFGKVLVRPTPTPAPTEEPDDYYFQRDASGNLVLDSDGDPVVYIPDGFKVPTGFQRDENGKLVLDGNGDPIMLFGEVAPEVTPAPEATEEPAPEVTEEPTPEVTEEPAPEVTEEPAPEVTEEPAPEVTEEPAPEVTEEPAPEVTEEPAPEVTEEPAPEVTEEPAPEVTEEPTEEVIPEEPTEEVIPEEPTEEVIPEEPTEEVIPEEPVEEPMPTVPTDNPVDENGNPLYLVDAEGNLVLDENGSPYLAAEYTFDENGNVIAIVEEVEEEPVEEVDPLEGLRQIMVVLHEGETVLPLYAEANAESAVVAEISAGELLYVKDIAAEWSYAVYGEIEGYVLTSKIALYNEETTPEEEEIIRTVVLTSNVADKEAVYAGEEVVLYAILTGFENDQYTIQWQYSTDGGLTYVDIEGATELQYAFIIDDSNAGNVWKINITIVEPVVEESAEA